MHYGLLIVESLMKSKFDINNVKIDHKTKNY